MVILRNVEGRQYTIHYSLRGSVKGLIHKIHGNMELCRDIKIIEADSRVGLKDGHDKITFFFNGENLDNDMALELYGITEESCIDIVPILKK